MWHIKTCQLIHPTFPVRCDALICNATSRIHELPSRAVLPLRCRQIMHIKIFVGFNFCGYKNNTKQFKCNKKQQLNDAIISGIAIYPSCWLVLIFVLLSFRFNSADNDKPTCFFSFSTPSFSPFLPYSSLISPSSFLISPSSFLISPSHPSSLPPHSSSLLLIPHLSLLIPPLSFSSLISPSSFLLSPSHPSSLPPPFPPSLPPPPTFLPSSSLLIPP